MTDSYHARKDEVLRIYDEYRSFNSSFKKETLEKRAENIRNGKFYLMIAGEAKSGKSTFINAYLGEEILPMNVLQCTSALIEITYGEAKTLTATYADDNNDYRTGEKDIRDFLQDHAAIQEEYRAIPVTAINNEILIKSKGDIKPSEVEALFEKEKPDNRNLEEYKNLIWKYINEKKGSWGKIVVKITLSFPLSEDVKDVTIIDSPGINALGLLGDVTEEFIEKADALILTKPLTAQAIESKSFMQFLSGSARDRCKGAVLLVLTQKAGIKDEDLYKLRSQAAVEYGPFNIPEEHIAAVDSKLELYRHICEKKTEDDIENFLEREGFDAAQNRWFKSKQRKTDFLLKLEEDSGFFDVKRMLEQFGRTAKNKQLYDFLSLISQGYEDMTRTLEDHRAELEKAENPAELRLNIDKKNNEIEEIKLKMNKGIQEIRNNYTAGGDTARIKKTADEEFEKFKQSIQDVKSIDGLKKKALEGQKRFDNIRRELQKQIIEDCNKNLIEIANITTVSFESLAPVFTEEDLNKIEDETKKNAYERQNFEKKFCSSEYKYGPSYSQDKHTKGMLDAVLENLENTKSQMINTIHTDCVKVTYAYGEELKKNAAQKTKEYNDLCDRLNTAEKMCQERESVKADLQTINGNAAHLRETKGGLENVIR